MANEPDTSVNIPKEQAQAGGANTALIAVACIFMIVFFFGGFGFGYLAGYRGNDDDTEVVVQTVEVLVTAAPTPSPDAAVSTLKILHINDHHSHLVLDEFEFDVSDLQLEARTSTNQTITSVAVPYGGFSKVVTMYKEKLAASPHNTLKLHAGDAITGTLYYSLYTGKADAKMMNEVCFDAFTLGNHEFDDGDSVLAQFIDDLMVGDCKTPVIAGNVIPGPDSDLLNYVSPYVIKTYGAEGQFKVGIVGIDVKNKTLISSRPDPGTDILDETETAQKYINELLAMNITKIIVMSHFGHDNEVEMATKLRGVDVIVGGDSHTLLGSSDLTKFGWAPQDVYPVERVNADGKKVCIVQAWQYSSVVGELDVAFDENGDVISCSGQPNVGFDAVFEYDYTSSEARSLSAADTATVRAALEAIRGVSVVADDASAAAVLAVYQEDAKALMEDTITTVPETLCLERIPGQGRSTHAECHGQNASTFVRGSDAGMIVAKAFLNVTKTADIAIQNGGGVRVDIATGDFTMADAYEVLPFTNTLATVVMKGQSIIDVLEDAVQTAVFGASTGAYPYAYGVRFDVNVTQPFGSRILNVEVNPRVEGVWAPIDVNTTYVVVTNDYTAAGNDGYTSFEDGTNYTDTYTAYVQGLVDYAKVIKTLDRVPYDAYSTKSYTGTDGCNHTVGGCAKSY